MVDFGMCRQEFDSLSPEEQIEEINCQIELTEEEREERKDKS